LYIFDLPFHHVHFEKYLKYSALRRLHHTVATIANRRERLYFRFCLSRSVMIPSWCLARLCGGGGGRRTAFHLGGLKNVNAIGIDVKNVTETYIFIHQQGFISSWKRTCPNDNDLWSFKQTNKLVYINNPSSNLVSPYLRFSDLRKLHIDLPVDDNTKFEQVKLLLDRESRLSSLGFRCSSLLLMQFLPIKFNSKSIRQRYLQKNWSIPRWSTMSFVLGQCIWTIISLYL